jgi:cysteine-rich repeat protein
MDKGHMQRSALTVGLFLLTLGLATESQARIDGIFGRSGREGSTCTGCHTSTSPTPTVTVSGLSTNLTEGMARTVTVTVESNQGDVSGRFAGFGAAISQGSGSLATNGDATVRVSGTEATHVLRQSLASGSVIFSFDIENPVAGSWTFWVTGNDVNGNMQSGSGDVPESTQVAFTVEGCGDGVINGGEDCDDGGQTPGDGCSATCTEEMGWTCTMSGCTETCGDNMEVGTETCDDGNEVDDGNGCAANCQRNDQCGNGVLESLYEACDDSGTAPDDGCSSTCTVETGWTCDMGGCTEICGDNLEVGSETCDDGDEIDDGNGCSATCQRNDNCGNDQVESLFEDCDDGLNQNGDGCSATCQEEAGWTCGPSSCTENCGDGMEVGSEACDDGNQIDDGNGCTGTCTRNDVCGNNQRESLFEDCDDGNQVDDGNGCSGACERNNVCGNGSIEGLFEACDDSNTLNLDGCSSACSVEPGWNCGSGTCLEVCGDSMVVGSETCDDGNQIDNSNGCGANCARNDVCGNGDVEALFEACDDGLHCEDGTPCVSMGTCSGIGDGLCLPRSEDGCSSSCQVEGLDAGPDGGAGNGADAGSALAGDGGPGSGPDSGLAPDAGGNIDGGAPDGTDAGEMVTNGEDAGGGALTDAAVSTDGGTSMGPDASDMSDSGSQPGDDGGTGPADAGGGDAPDAANPTIADAGPQPDSGPSTDDVDAGASGSDGEDPESGDADAAGGCTCTSASGASPLATGLGFLFGLWILRRRGRARTRS